MASNKITVEIKIKWWFTHLYWPLLKTSLFIARTLNKNIEPNHEKLEYWLKKAAIVKHQNKKV